MLWTVYDYKNEVVAYTDNEEDAKFLANCYNGYYHCEGQYDNERSYLEEY